MNLWQPDHHKPQSLEHDIISLLDINLQSHTIFKYLLFEAETLKFLSNYAICFAMTIS